MMGVLNRDIRLSRNDGDAISEISNIAESPLDPEDPLGRHRRRQRAGHDGRRRDWTEVSGAITGVKNGTFVSRIVASEASRGTAYVPFDAHRDGDFAPYIFRTTDFGKTWTSVTTGLPKDDASVRSLVEYPGHPNVLFAGTERAVFVTHDSGAHWTRLRANLPDHAVRRHRRASADEGSGPRHARPRDLDSRRRVADRASGRRRSRRSRRICSTCRARR